MPIAALHTNKEIYYIGEPVACVATIVCSTVGGIVDGVATYITEDRVKWLMVANLQGENVCGIGCIFGCRYDAPVATIQLSSPGTWYIGTAILGPLEPGIEEQFAANPLSVHQVTVMSDLPAGQGACRIITTPGGADIYVDGELWGEQTPSTVVASVGDHQVKLILPGYTDFTLGIRFMDGVTGEYDHIFTNCDLLCQITQTIEKNALLIGVASAVVIGGIVLVSMTSPGQRSRLVSDTKKTAKGAYNATKKVVRERYKGEDEL